MDNINTGEGKIINHNGQKIGVYKDENGQTFTVSPYCTYDGCLVNWDKQQKIWICPCCGSRYNYDDKVISGPATKDLAKKAAI